MKIFTRHHGILKFQFDCLNKIFQILMIKHKNHELVKHQTTLTKNTQHNTLYFYRPYELDRNRHNRKYGQKIHLQIFKLFSLHTE